MRLLDVALAHAARGWFVFPCKPRDKYPITPNGWHDASRSEELIRKWWTRTPDANVGIACGMSGLAVLDIDKGFSDASQATDWLLAHNVPATYAVRSGGRPGFRIQLYYSGAVPDVHGWELDGCHGDVKSLGGYVLAMGSVHPSSELYEPWGGIGLDPDSTPDFVRVLKSPNTGSGKNAEPVEGGRHAYLTKIAGKMRNAGLGVDAMEAALLQHNQDIVKPPLPDEDVKHIAASVARYDVAPLEATVTIGGKTPAIADATAVDEVAELDPNLRATPLPVYPLSVFEDTLYMDFAKRAAAGNFVPLEFFIEGAMTYAGAMAADNLSGMSEVITPRLYTVLLAMAGLGKGTTFRCLRKLVPPQRMLDSITDSNVPHTGACVALLANAGSEPALNDALLGWRCVCLNFEEMDRMMEKTRIEGSGGALMSVIRTLFDDTFPGITTTSQRKVVAPLGCLSLLGAMTPSLWRQAMEGRDSYGSGLGGRFNLIATNVSETTSTLLPMDIGELRGTLERKLAALEASPTTIPTENTALKVLADWWEDSKGQPHYNRVNVIAHRKALHIAWMRDTPIITKEIMLQAIRLADYLVAVRDAFAVTKGEDRTAIGENRVMHILKQIAPKAVSSKRVVALLDGLMSRASVYRALESLVNSGEAEKLEVKKEGLRGYAVYRCLTD